MKLTILTSILLLAGACAHKQPRSYDGMANVFNQKFKASPQVESERKPACVSSKTKTCK